MWIRSQDKTVLTNVNCFSVIAMDSKLDSCEGCDIGAYIDDENGRYSINDLGVYSTKEKALKVLDMMEHFRNVVDANKLTFQMPQDDEVK